MTLYARVVTRDGAALYVCGSIIRLDEKGDVRAPFVSEPCDGCGGTCSTRVPCRCCAEQAAAQ